MDIKKANSRSLIFIGVAHVQADAPFQYLAERTGLEPATSDVTGRHSNQLNYHSNTGTAQMVSIHLFLAIVTSPKAISLLHLSKLCQL